MPSRRPPRPVDRRPASAAQRLPLSHEVLRQRGLEVRDPQALPPIEVRGLTPHPFVFRRRLGEYSPYARPGDLVRLVQTGGETLGFGLFNPRAEIAVRQLQGGAHVPGPDWWQHRLKTAVELRRGLLKLDEVTNAYRVVHAEGDGLSGLVIDRFGDVLVVEAFALGMYQRAEAILDVLTPLCETQHGILKPGPATEEHEGFTADPIGSEDLPARVEIREYGTRFRVDFASTHKTGFYCDQRENRKLLTEFTAGKSVLDLCCYTGGFAVQAKVLGEAERVTGVDVDEGSIETARGNANLNQARVQFVQADVFAYVRDLQRNGTKYDIVVLDPPKLISSREMFEEGSRKYFDLNRLAMSLVNPGGLLVTCSCSGMLSREQFIQTISTAPEFGRRATIFRTTGAAADHPVSTWCPESEYLKVVWMRLE